MLSEQRMDEIGKLVQAGKENELDPQEFAEWNQQIEQENEDGWKELERRADKLVQKKKKA